MDVSVLHAVTEELAALLSEVTQGDLELPAPRRDGDIGDLYLHLIEQNLRVVSTLSNGTAPPTDPGRPTRRAALANSVNAYGGGFEGDYRRSVHLMLQGFGAVPLPDPPRPADPRIGTTADPFTLYEQQVKRTIETTWELARALGLADEPATDPAEATRR